MSSLRQNHRRYLLLSLILLSTLLILGCPKQVPPPSGVHPEGQSPKMIAFQAVDTAFDVYFLGMTTLRTLQKSGVITEAKFVEVKDKVGWPVYNAIKAADDALQAWVVSSTDANYGKMQVAFKAMGASQKSFSDLLTSLQGGRVYLPGIPAGVGLRGK